MLDYWRLDDRCQWVAADAKTFRASDDPAVPTVVSIHGNRTDADDAVEKGWNIYQSIRAQSDRPLRYVIWSWPADREFRRNGPDVRLKAAYSDVEAWYLAQWLAQFRPGVRVSLIGHSFGPRIITGALHLLAGGQLAGRGLPKDTVAAWTAGKRNPDPHRAAGSGARRRLAGAGRLSRSGPLAGRSDVDHVQRLRSRLAVVSADVRSRWAAGHGVRRPVRRRRCEKHRAPRRQLHGRPLP